MWRAFKLKKWKILKGIELPINVIESVKIEKLESLVVTGFNDGSGNISVAKEDAVTYLRRGYFLKDDNGDGQVTLAKKFMIKHVLTTRPGKVVYKENQQTGERVSLTAGEVRRLSKGSRFNPGYELSVSEDLEYWFKPK